MTPEEKQSIVALFRQNGVNPTESQIKGYYNNRISAGQRPFQDNPSSIYDAYQNDEGLGTQVVEGAINAAWNLFDTAALGLPGLAVKSIDEEFYEKTLEDLNDNAISRSMGMLGSIGGFFVPMTGVTRGLNLLGRQAARRSGMKALESGKKLKDIATPTTEVVQKAASKKLEKTLKKQFGINVVSDGASSEIIKKVSDDIIGFSTKGKGVVQKILHGGQAHTLDMGIHHVNNAKQMLQSVMPNRLVKELAENGITGLTRRQVDDLSKDLIKLLATRPYNSIDTIIMNQFTGNVGRAVGRVVGSAAQEAASMMVVGSAMDGVQALKGEISYDERSFLNRLGWHGVIGGAFGSLAKFFPGGSTETSYQRFYKMSGLANNSINKTIKSAKNLDDLKQLALSEMKYNGAYQLMIDGKMVSKEMLRKHGSIKDIGKLKNSMIEANKRLLKTYRGPYMTKYIKEEFKDFAGSLPRMGMGALAFNIETLAGIDGRSFDYMSGGEIVFHMALGAAMSKRGLALNPDTKPKSGFHFGQRDYYYDTDLRDVAHSLHRLRINSNSMGDVVNQYTGDTYSDLLSQSAQPDADKIIEVLIDNNVIYDTSTGRMEESHTELSSDPNHDLYTLISPLTGILKSRNYEKNPQTTKAEQENALKQIKGLKSETLSSGDNTQLLNSPTNIRRSTLMASQTTALDLQSRMVELYDNLYKIIAEGDDGLPVDERSETGHRYDFLLNFDNVSNRTTHDDAIIRKFNEIDAFLRQEGIVKVRDIELNQKGLTHTLNNSKLERMRDNINELESAMGREAFGESLGFVAKIDDPALFDLMREVNYENNTRNVLEVMEGRETPRSTKQESEAILGLINEILVPDNATESGVMVNNETNIEFLLDSKNWSGTTQELIMLQRFVNQLWRISSTSRPKEPMNAKSTVSMNKVSELVTKLEEAGMPTPDTFGFDRWVERMITNGMDKALEGLDVSPQKASAVRMLMENKVIAIERSTDGSATALSTFDTITIDQVKRAFYDRPDMTDKDAQRYVDLFNDVFDNIGRKIVQRRRDFNTTLIDRGFLDALPSIDSYLNVEKVMKKTTDTVNKLAGFHKDSINRLSVLDDERANADNESDAGKIDMLIDHEREKSQIYSDFIVAFNQQFSGSAEITRASAFLNFTNETAVEGKTVYDLFKELKEIKPGEDVQLETTRDLITKLAREINENTNNASHVRRSWDEVQSARERSIELQEIEGHNKDKSGAHTDPDKFFQDYNIEQKSIFKGLEPVYQIKNYESNSEALAALYEVHKGKGTPEKFIDTLFEVAGSTKEQAPQKLLAQITQLNNLMERRFAVRRLTVNENGTAVFSNSEISHGWLTDVYTELFGTSPMVMLNSQVIRNNGRYSSFSGNENLRKTIYSHLKGGSIRATLGDPISGYVDQMDVGSVTVQKRDEKYFDMIPLGEQILHGSYFPVTVDENITIALPQSSFDSFARGWLMWFKRYEQTPYYKSMLRRGPQLAKDTLNDLKKYSKKLGETRAEDGTYDPVKFSEGDNAQNYMHDAMHKMFTSMYSERANHNWLQNIYGFDSSGQRKHIKYKRLAQNQGYSRNSRERKQALKRVYENSSDSYARELVNKFTDMETAGVFVVDDGFNASEKNKDSNGLITDSRAVAEHSINRMEDEGLITEEQKDAMLAHLKESSSIHAEQVNGMTIVNKEYLDYLLLLNGDSELIGDSAGQKPVGLTSWEDADRNIHVMYNKTHYFYDKQYDSFFAENPNILKIAFKSGAKVTDIIDPNTLENKFEPYSDSIPQVGSGITLSDMVNNLGELSGDQLKSVMPVQLDQSLSGVNYGKPHDAKILKQLGNWGSRRSQQVAYQWARADLAQRFVEVVPNFYDPTKTAVASAEAKSFMRTEGNKDATLNAENENASFGSIWIMADGVAFDEAVSKGYFDSMIKRRYIDEAGVFDGYTDAGGSAVLRGNSALDLDIPVFEGSSGNEHWVRLGEAKISDLYLDRRIHNIDQYGVAVKGDPNIRSRQAYKENETLTIAIDLGTDGDVLLDLKTGHIRNGKGHLNLKNLDSDTREGIESIRKQLLDEINKTDGVRTYRDFMAALNSDSIQDIKTSRLVVMGLPAPRTGPHDAVLMKVKDVLPREEGGLMEMNSYDLTMRAQRDFDTDKMYFYMDTPSRLVDQSFTDRILVYEATERPKTQPGGVDPLDRNQMDSYVDNINKYKKMFGKVVKTHRKLTYAKNTLEMLNGIDLGNGSKIVWSNNTSKAMRDLVSDTQAAVDIYNGFPSFLNSKWEDTTLFGISGLQDSGFFRIEEVEKDPVLGSKQKPQTILTDESHKLIIKKIIDDFGRLLSYEGNIYEAGEAKTPRYQDMVSGYKMFRDSYRPDRINTSFYRYIEKSINKQAADDLFKKDGVMQSLLSKLALHINRREFSDNFLKSLDAVASRDQMKIKEIYGSNNDHFNGMLDKIAGRFKAEEYNHLLTTGEIVDKTEYTDSIDLMWESFHDVKNMEKSYSQINVIEEQIRHAEVLINKEKAKEDAFQNSAFIQIQTEDLALKRAALLRMVDRMSILKEGEGGLPGQSVHYKGFKMNNESDYVVRDGKTGRVLKTNYAENRVPGGYKLKKNEVGIYNPVMLKPATTHDIISGAAWANTTLNFYSNIQNDHLKDFRNIVRKTRGKITESVIKVMESKGARDWTAHDMNVRNAIDSGLNEVLQKYGDPNNNFLPQEFIANMTEGTETYGKDFIKALLVPIGKGNPNEFYFQPQTGMFIPSVRSQSKTVVQAVFKALDRWNVLEDRTQFIKDLARTHRGHYDAIVAAQGFKSGLERIQDASFEGSVTSHVNQKIANSPFMTKDRHKSMTQFLETPTKIDSELHGLMNQILNDNAILDPMSLIRIKQRIIDEYGEDVYKSYFQKHRADLTFDGVALSPKNGTSGQLIGEIVGERNLTKGRAFNKIPSKKNGSIGESIKDVIGYANEHGPDKSGDC